MNTLTQILYAASNALLLPVVLLLLFAFALTIYGFGGLAAEAVERRRKRTAFSNWVDELKSAPERRVRIREAPAACGFPARAFQLPIVDREKVLDDLELESERLLGRLQLGIRLGPILGLAGTLIPLGPALVALSSGDVATLSAKLVVAFTTTVLGLLVGGACFAMHAVRRHWYMRDLNDIEFVFKRIGKRHEEDSPVGNAGR